jgi:hypothetical protein
VHILGSKFSISYTADSTSLMNYFLKNKYESIPFDYNGKGKVKGLEKIPMSSSMSIYNPGRLLDTTCVAVLASCTVPGYLAPAIRRVALWRHTLYGVPCHGLCGNMYNTHHGLSCLWSSTLYATMSNRLVIHDVRYNFPSHVSCGGRSNDENPNAKSKLGGGMQPDCEAEDGGNGACACNQIGREGWRGQGGVCYRIASRWSGGEKEANR